MSIYFFDTKKKKNQCSSNNTLNPDSSQEKRIFLTKWLKSQQSLEYSSVTTRPGTDCKYIYSFFWISNTRLVNPWTRDNGRKANKYLLSPPDTIPSGGSGVCIITSVIKTPGRIKLLECCNSVSLRNKMYVRIHRNIIQIHCGMHSGRNRESIDRHAPYYYRYN